jgi:hypothetical protein
VNRQATSRADATTLASLKATKKPEHSERVRAQYRQAVTRLSRSCEIDLSSAACADVHQWNVLTPVLRNEPFRRRWHGPSYACVAKRPIQGNASQGNASPKLSKLKCAVGPNRLSVPRATLCSACHATRCEMESDVEHRSTGPNTGSIVADP